MLVTQSYPTLCNPKDGSPPGSSVQGILQARILEWVAIPFSRGSSGLRDQTPLHSRQTLRSEPREDINARSHICLLDHASMQVCLIYIKFPLTPISSKYSNWWKWEGGMWEIVYMGQGEVIVFPQSIRQSYVKMLPGYYVLWGIKYFCMITDSMPALPKPIPWGIVSVLLQSIFLSPLFHPLLWETNCCSDIENFTISPKVTASYFFPFKEYFGGTSLYFYFLLYTYIANSFFF